MELSSVTESTAKAVEPSKSAGQTTLPDFFVDNSEELMTLITSYYNYLNEFGLPSQVINNITKNHDVDLADDENSANYLDAIGLAIAKNIPQSSPAGLDRRRLYKIIARYYTTRGSDDSVFSFFKIFYDETVSLMFPKEFLMETSSEKSFLTPLSNPAPSDFVNEFGENINPNDVKTRFLLRDSYFWQEFSYVISSERSKSEWLNQYLRFVHPAGLKLFVKLSLVGLALNDWLKNPENGLAYLTTDEEDPINYDNIDPCDYWKYIDWGRFFEDEDALHTPKIQACLDRDPFYLLKVLMPDNGLHYLTHIRNVYECNESFLNLKGDPVDERYLRSYYRFLTILFFLYNDVNQIELFYNRYNIDFKFFDAGGFADGYGDYVIGDTFTNSHMIKPYDAGDSTQFKAFSVQSDQDGYTTALEFRDADSFASPGDPFFSAQSITVGEEYNFEIPTGIVGGTNTRNIIIYAPVVYNVINVPQPDNYSYAYVNGNPLDLTITPDNNWTFTVVYKIIDTSFSITQGENVDFFLQPFEGIEYYEETGTLLESETFVWNIKGRVSEITNGPTEDFVYYLPDLETRLDASNNELSFSSVRSTYTTLGDYINALLIHDDFEVVGIPLEEYYN